MLKNLNEKKNQNSFVLNIEIKKHYRKIQTKLTFQVLKESQTRLYSYQIHLE